MDKELTPLEMLLAVQSNLAELGATYRNVKVNPMYTLIMNQIGMYVKFLEARERAEFNGLIDSLKGVDDE